MTKDMRHRITLQEAVETPDGGGGFTVAWQDISPDPTIYAALAGIDGTDAFIARKKRFFDTATFKIRHRTDLTPGLRLVWQNKAYEIVSVLDAEGQGAYLEIIARRTLD